MAVGTAYRPNVYSSDQEYFKDLAEAYAAEFRVLYDEGLRSIQTDDPCLLFFVTVEFRSGCVADKVDPDELLDQYIWAHNQWQGSKFLERPRFNLCALKVNSKGNEVIKR